LLRRVKKSSHNHKFFREEDEETIRKVKLDKKKEYLDKEKRRKESAIVRKIQRKYLIEKSRKLKMEKRKREL